MKTMLFTAVVSIVLSCPTAQAVLIPLTEAQMRAVFGQAGINVEISFLDYESRLGSIAYEDYDEATGKTAYAIIRDRYIHKIYTAMYTEEDFLDSFTDVTRPDLAPLGKWTGASPLSINTGICPTLTNIHRENTYPDGPIPADAEKVTGLVVNLPTVLVNTVKEELTIAVSLEGAVNDNREYLKITTERSAMFILGGTAEIAAR